MNDELKIGMDLRFNLFGYMLLPRPLLAQQKRFSGLIQYTYQKDEDKNIDAESKKSSFIQEYKLRYQGHIYSPKLLMLRQLAVHSEKRIPKPTNPIPGDNYFCKNRDYNLKLDFIQGTKYPFTMYKEKFELPTWTIQPEQSFLTRQPLIDMDFLAMPIGAGTNLKYDFHQTVQRRRDSHNRQTRRTGVYYFGIDSRKGERHIGRKLFISTQP